MIKFDHRIDLKPDQPMHLIPLGDIHWDTDDCDRERLQRLVDWIRKRLRKGEAVGILGLGDYLDFASPSERRRVGDGLHETTYKTLDQAHIANVKELLAVLSPIKHCFIALVTGHHHYLFTSRKVMGDWQGRSSDAWLAKQLGARYCGNGTMFVRLRFPHNLRLDVLALHGGGSAQTPGGRVQKRIRYSEIAPGAHIVVSGHDNAKLAYPRSGLDYDHGKIKRYVLGSGSFQRAYMEGEEAGYAEQMGLIPADLGVTIVEIRMEQRNGRWRLDYHASV